MKKRTFTGDSFLPFIPSSVSAHPDFQTIGPHLLGRVPGYLPDIRGVENKAVAIATQDPSGDKLLLEIHEQDVIQRAPAVVLVHGMEGSSESVYMVKLTDRLLRKGFHVIRMNLRGCGKGRRLSYNVYNAGLTIDLEAVLEYVYSVISRKIAVVGFSLGGNLLLKYLGEKRKERNRQLKVLGGSPVMKRIKNRYIETWVAVSPPLDIKATQLKIDSEDAKFYRDAFIKELMLRTKDGGLYQELGRHIKKRPQRMYDFDSVFTCPAGNFKNPDEYYKTCSCLPYLKGIKIPGVLLHALDDPMIPPEPVHEVPWEKIKQIEVHLTEKGGHLGWFSKKHPDIPDRRWMDYVIENYLTDWKNQSIP